MRKYRVFMNWKVIVAAAVQLVCAGVLAGVSFYLSGMLERVFAWEAGGEGFAAGMLMAFVLGYGISSVFQFGKNVMGNVIYWLFTREINMGLLRRAMRFPASWFWDKDAAGVWGMINIPAQQIAAYFGALVKSVSSAILFAAYLAIIFRIHYLAGFLVCLIVPVYILLTAGAGKKISACRGRKLELDRELSSMETEVFANVSTVKTMRKEEYFCSRIGEKIEECNRVERLCSLYDSYWTNIVSLVRLVFPLLAVCLMVRFQDRMRITLGEILVLYTYIPLFCNGFQEVYDVVHQFFATKPSAGQISELLDQPVEPEGGTEVEEFRELVTRDVRIAYPNGTDIRVPDMCVRRGGKIFFSGESGAGKSSFFHALVGMQEYQGSIRVNGVELREIELESLRRMMGISFQKFELQTGTVRENILLGREENGLDEILGLARLSELWALSGDEGDSARVLSGGEKARVNLAQNLLGSPQVVLLDETLEGVEEHVERGIIEQFGSRFPDRTLLYISHRTANVDLFDQKVAQGAL